MNDASFLSTASKLAQEAAQAVLKFYQEPLEKNRKEDRSFVTDADLRSDEILRKGLGKAFPDHRVLTEEDGLSGNADSEYVWLIDPLDGTSAFVKGIPGFCVMVGLLKAGRPCLGVVVDPLEGSIYEAVSGEGAFLIRKGGRSRLKVSTRDDFSEMPLVTSTGISPERLEEVRKKIPSPLYHPINSVGIKVGLLVRQMADIYVSHHSVHLWDTCAPQVILEEAGGRITYADGGPLRYDLLSDHDHRNLIVASNGARHQDLVRQLTSRGDGQDSIFPQSNT